MPKTENAVAKTAENKPTTFSEMLSKNLDDVEMALPVGFNKVRFVQESVALLNENEAVAKFAKQYGIGQVKLGILKAAYLNLSFANREAYLIPYGSTLQFMIDYRGSVKLAKRYAVRSVKNIYAKVVREGDDFSIEDTDGEQKVNFRPKPFNDGKIIGVYAVCEYADGGRTVETMTRKEIDMVRSKSRSGAKGPWADWYDQMACKAVIHRLCKMIDLDYESVYQQSLVAEDQKMMREEEQPVKDVFDAEAEVIDIDA